MTDFGIEAFLWGEGWLPLPFRKAEKEVWDREAPLHRLLPSWYGRLIEVKYKTSMTRKFRVYAVGAGENGTILVKGRTDTNEEIRVQV